MPVLGEISSLLFQKLEMTLARPWRRKSGYGDWNNHSEDYFEYLFAGMKQIKTECTKQTDKLIYVQKESDIVNIESKFSIGT